MMVENAPYEYRVGGSLPEHAPSYVVRQADQDFYQGLKAGDFCYVFNSRQMGKTSLLVRTLHRLRSEGVACTTIDVSGRGSGDIKLEQWYAGIVYTLIKDFNLANPLQFMKSWWQERDFLDPAQRLAEMIETILLPNTTTQIAIFIDEIDSTLSLNFSTDDFFALIRSCYDKRSTNANYQRLTFALIGVARPSDLIADKRRTPFNIGRAIELTGFTLTEAFPLAFGLEGHAENSRATLARILDWTKGQPFLTQKVCNLLVRSNVLVKAQEEKVLIDRLIQTELINDWEVKDNPPHFKTISTRLTANEKQASSLLGLYQQILNHSSAPIDDLPEERELQLSGIAIKVGDELRVANPVYAEIFGRSWVDKQLDNLRPYEVAVKEWQESNKKDKSRLLRGQALEDALNWSKGKSLSSLDSQFLGACREQRIHEANQEVLQRRIKQLWLLSGIAILFAICTLYLGIATGREKEKAQKEEEKAQVATLTSKNALNQALIKSDSSKNSIKTLIGTLEATRLFQEQKQSLKAVDQEKLQQETEINLQYAIHGTIERNILKHESTVTGVEYSSNGKFIASVSKDKFLRIWQPDGQLIFDRKHSEALHHLAISNDSQKVAVVGEDSQVRLWDVQTKKVSSILRRNNNDKFIRVAITPDSQYVAAATDNNGKDAEVIIWQITSGEIIKTLKFPRIASASQDSKYGFRDLKFSADGKIIAAASTDSTIKTWQWQTDRTPQILTGHQDWVYALSFRPDGKWLISSGGGSDKSIKIWEIQDGIFKLKKTIEKAHAGALYVAVNPQNNQFATAGSGDRTIKIWDFDKIISSPVSVLTSNDFGNVLLTTIGGNQSEYKGISYSPNGQRLALPGSDYQVTIWEPDRSLEKNISASQLAIKRVIYSPSGQYIATAGSDNTIRIWKSDGSLLKTFVGHKDWIFGLSFSPDEKLIASASEDNTIKIWQVVDGKLIRTLKHDSFAYDVSFSPDARYLASVGNDGKLKLWNASNGKLLQDFKITTNDHWVSRVTFSPNGKYLATNTKQGVELRHTSDFNKISILNDNGKEMKTLLRVSFSPDSRTIAASDVGGIVRLWNVEDGKSLVKHKGHQDAIDDIQFSPDSQEIATTSGADRQIKFWSRAGELRRTIEGFSGQSLAFSPNGQTFTAADGDGVMRFWNLAKLERKYLTLQESYNKGCQQLQEYLAHLPKNEPLSIDPKCGQL
jgi:WD40 repeat protein